MTEAHALFAAARGLLVDLDGTLVDSSGPVGRAWTAFAHRHGLDPDTVIAAAQGRPSRETVARFAPADQRDAEAAMLEDAEVGDTDGTLALPGAAEVLADPRPVAIVTSCSTPLLAARLAAAGLAMPAVAVTSSDVTRGKPDPEPYALGADRLGLPPAACVALEDAPAGVASARAAGVPVIALLTTTPRERLQDADAVAGSLRELL